MTYNVRSRVMIIKTVDESRIATIRFFIGIKYYISQLNICRGLTRIN